jgi:glyoxylase-like metal-dependent hydrolase (beta-lactamase superfamily II)/predicted small lipoprotein YifL
MTDVTRRNLVLTTGAAAAAFGLNGPLEFIPSAEAQAKKGPTLLEKGFAKFKVGEIEVIQVYDGFNPRPIDDKFVKNASVDQLKAALKKGGNASETSFQIPFTITFIKSKGKTIMFDSSTGGQLADTAGLMMKRNMYAAGIEPSKISTIIVTHFHPDHISGMISKDTNSRVFPDAEIIVPGNELAFWNDPTKVPDAAKALGARVQATLGKWKNVRQVKDGDEVIPGVRALATNGHTPGHTSYIVSSGRRSLIVSGDVTNVPAVNLANPSWHVVFDADAAMAETSRRKLFDRAIKDKMIVTGYHWGLPGAGTIKKDGAGYAFLPVGA